MRGYFEIGVLHPKTATNLGTLWRSAYQLGAAGIFVIGARFSRQASDTLKTWRHVPLREYRDLDDFLSHRPYACPLIGIEMGGKDLAAWHHPDRCTYLLGAEDHGLTPGAMAACQSVVSIPAERTSSFNVAVAGSIVMWHRMISGGIND